MAAGALPWVGAGLGALGLIQNERARGDARDSQNAALSAQERALALEQEKYSDLQAIHQKLWGMVETFDRSGGFDPEHYVRKAQEDTARYESEDMGNLGGALRVLGYRPNSSEIGVRLDATKHKYRQDLNVMATGLRQNSIFNKLNAYNSTLGSVPNQGGVTAALNNIAQTNLGLSQMYRGQIGNPANFLMSVLPFFKALQQPQQNNAPVLYHDNGTQFGTNNTA